MKIKLTPELAYIIGFWRKRRTHEGIGIKGEKEKLGVFLKEILDLELTTSDKTLTEENRAYFYHTAYRKFFQDVVENQLERFKYVNDYAANYLAGLFDSVGGIDDKGMVYFEKFDRRDEMMMLRLGFGSRKRGERWIVEKPLLFLAFIKNYVRIYKDHKIFEYVKNVKGIKEAEPKN
jgi:hypothetical protein